MIAEVNEKLRGEIYCFDTIQRVKHTSRLNKTGNTLKRTVSLKTKRYFNQVSDRTLNAQVTPLKFINNSNCIKIIFIGPQRIIGDFQCLKNMKEQSHCI